MNKALLKNKLNIMLNTKLSDFRRQTYNLQARMIPLWCIIFQAVLEKNLIFFLQIP